MEENIDIRADQENSTNNIVPLSTEVPPTSNNSKKNILGLVVTVALLILGLTYVSIQLLQTKTQKNIEQVTNLDESSTPIAEEETWNVFRSEKYGIEFMYPQDWIVGDCPDPADNEWVSATVCGVQTSDFFADGGMTTSGASFSIGVNKGSDFNRSEGTLKVINNIEGKLIPPIGEQGTFIFQKNELEFIVAWSPYQGSIHNQTLEKILSTLKITETSLKLK